MKNIHPSCLLLLAATALAQKEECNTELLGVNLARCPLPVWNHKETPTSEDNPLILSYRIARHTFPAINQTTRTRIPNELIRLQARTYWFENTDFEPQLPPPGMFWEKGADVFIELHNDLDINPFDDNDFVLAPEDLDAEHNTINIHTHGLHIDSFSDDPSREIHVGDTELIHFELPADHGGGMNWYHPHIEGVGEMVLSSGMWSSLEIETDPDGYEIPKAILELPSHILAINRMFPLELIDLRDGFTNPFFDRQGVPPIAARRDVTHPDWDLQFNPDIEEALGFDIEATSYTFVNGYLKPKLVVQSGQWTRFKIIFVGGQDGRGNDSDLKFRIGKNPDFATLGDNSDYGPFNEFLGTQCKVKLIGKDGVYLRQSRDLDFESGERIWLSPANRADILVKCDIETADQCSIVDNTFAFIGDKGVDNRAEEVVESIPVLQLEIRKEGSATGELAEAEAEDPEFEFNVPSCLPAYNLDMVDLKDEEITEHLTGLTQEVLDTIASNTTSLGVARPFINTAKRNALEIEVAPFEINNERFRGYNNNLTVPNITVMEMQRVYNFVLRGDGHPLHIHLNHMQLLQDVDDGSNYHKRGDYVDTLNSACPIEGCNVNGNQRIEDVDFRIFIDRFFGRKLSHCHIMSHSDNRAIAEMFVLRDEEFLGDFVEPQFREECSEVIEIKELEEILDKRCGVGDYKYVIVLAICIQLLLFLICYCGYLVARSKVDRRRRESSVFDEQGYGEETFAEKRRKRKVSRRESGKDKLPYQTDSVDTPTFLEKKRYRDGAL
eukprot:augustus_masked-scaffold_32-processed-gene-0.33-mRNA-1 protein AED:1.00 eAED:1.00 QI:0/-1/0/0/-1/1/1/0/780